MASWSSPHDMARLLLAGGPFDGAEVGFLAPDQPPPAQIAWSGWFPWGFATLIHQWHGERTMDRGLTDALIYRPERWLTADAIPPEVADLAERMADVGATIVSAFDVPKEMIWPGL